MAEGRASDRPELSAEVFEGEPPNESATRVTLGGGPVAEYARGEITVEEMDHRLRPDSSVTEALIARFLAGEISAQEMVDGLRQHRSEDPLLKPEPLTNLERAQAAVRRINRGRQAMADESGERLEPVEPGELREGDRVVGIPEPVRGVVTGRFKSGELLYVDGCGYAPEAYAWQRVVVDPPLPTTPGTVIRCIHEWSDEEQVAKLVRDTDDSLVWSVTGLGYLIPPSKITKCLRVYDEGGSDGET